MKKVMFNGKLVDASELGPAYPELGASVAKYRRLAARAGSVMKMTREDRMAYADAVERAIKAKQRSELMRDAGPLGTPQYPVGEALRRAHRARLIASCSAERRARPDHVWLDMYEQAMREK